MATAFHAKLAVAQFFFIKCPINSLPFVTFTFSGFIMQMR